MPDEYGNIVPEDLNALSEYVREELTEHLELIQDLYERVLFGSFSDAQVLDQAQYQSPEEKSYGVGAVKVRIPELEAEDGVWIRPHRLLHGRAEVPPVGSWVRVVWQHGDSSYAEYYGAHWIDTASTHSDGKTRNFEEFAFQDPTKIFDKSAQNRLDAVRQNPSAVRVLESGAGFVIGIDDQSKKLDLRVLDGYELILTAGDGGKITIGAADPTAIGEPQAKTIDIAVDTGSTGGGYTLTTNGGKIRFKTTGGNIELEGGSTALEKSVLGDTLKAKLDTLIDDIVAHTHSTPVGPSSPPVNAADFTVLKSQLPDVLSPKVKNN